MLPSNWNEITVEQYNEIKEAPERQAGLFSLAPWIIAVLLDKEIEEIEDEWDAVEIAKEFQKVKWILEDPSGRLEEEIELNGISYRLKPPKKCTFGEAIDVFNIMDQEKAIEKTAALFYRRWKLNEWGQIEYEPRGYDLEQRAEIFEALPVGKICEVLNEFKRYNKTIRENYSALFDDAEDEPEEREPWEEEEETEQKEREGFNAKREKQRQEAIKKHGWFLIALDLVKGDATRINEAFKMPFSYVINILSIKHETKD